MNRILFLTFLSPNVPATAKMVPVIVVNVIIGLRKKYLFEKSNQNSPQCSVQGSSSHNPELDMMVRIKWTLAWFLNPYILSHYTDVIMSPMVSQFTGVSIVCSAVCPGTDQRKHQSSASLAFVREIHQWPVDSPHKGPVTRKMFPFDDVIMIIRGHHVTYSAKASSPQHYACNIICKTHIPWYTIANVGVNHS